MPDVEERSLYMVGTELMHGKPGAIDMSTFDPDDIATATNVYTTLIGANGDSVYDSLYGAVAATATDDGLTTGSLDAYAGVVNLFVTVTSANADHIIYLPATALLGQRITLQNAGTGYELRPDDLSGINGGTPAAGAESAIAATTTVTCVRISATAWKCMSQVANGTLSATEASSAA